MRNEVNKRKIGLGWTTSVYVSNKVSNVFNPFVIFVLISSFFTQINPLVSSKAPLTYSQIEVIYQQAANRQTIRIPIILFPHFTTITASISLCIPLFTKLAYSFIINKVHQIYIEMEASKLMKQSSNVMCHRYSEALRAQSLMGDIVKNIIKREGPQGLIIINATYFVEYSVAKPGNTLELNKSTPSRIDVTVPVQALVNNNQLVIHTESNKSSIFGFFDPNPFLPPTNHKIKITYWFKNNKHQCLYNDKELIELPNEHHLVA